MQIPIINGSNPSNPVDPAGNAAQSADHAKAKQAAKEFEALFASMMLHSMRKTVLQLNDEDNEFIPTSTGEKIFTDMLDDEYGKTMSSGTTLGLADLILKQIEGDKSNSASLNMLRGLKSAPWMLEKEFVPFHPTADSQATLGSVGQWQSIIDEASKQYGVDKDLISAVIAQESGGNQYAVSPRGAKGLMQLMDTTAQDLGVSAVFQPRQNILGGTKYLRQLLDKFNGNETLALASYNAGPAAVEKFNGVPPYDETQQYVGNVLTFKNRFAAETAPVKKDATHE
jgi:Rod binding domain-containing protein